MSGLPVFSEFASGWLLHHWKQSRPATVIVLHERRGIAVRLADRLVMCRAVRLILAQRRVGPADEHREIPALAPGPRADRVDGQSLDGEIARLEVEEQRRAGHERAQERRLSNAARPEDGGLDAAHLGQPLVGGDDGECAGHAATPVDRSLSIRDGRADGCGALAGP